MDSVGTNRAIFEKYRSILRNWSISHDWFKNSYNAASLIEIILFHRPNSLLQHTQDRAKQVMR